MLPTYKERAKPVKPAGLITKTCMDPGSAQGQIQKNSRLALTNREEVASTKSRIRKKPQGKKEPTCISLRFSFGFLMSSAKSWQIVTKILKKRGVLAGKQKAIPRGFRSARNGSHQKTGHKRGKRRCALFSLYMGSAEKGENVTRKDGFFCLWRLRSQFTYYKFENNAFILLKAIEKKQ